MLPPDSSFAVRQLERVDKLIASGNMPAARSMLTDAANRGDAAAAFALAATFDPIEIETLGRHDVTPDVTTLHVPGTKGLTNLGSTEAQARLQRLSDAFRHPDLNEAYLELFVFPGLTKPPRSYQEGSYCHLSPPSLLRRGTTFFCPQCAPSYATGRADNCATFFCEPRSMRCAMAPHIENSDGSLF